MTHTYTFCFHSGVTAAIFSADFMFRHYLKEIWVIVVTTKHGCDVGFLI